MTPTSHSRSIHLWALNITSCSTPPFTIFYLPGRHVYTAEIMLASAHNTHTLDASSQLNGHCLPKQSDYQNTFHHNIKTGFFTCAKVTALHIFTVTIQFNIKPFLPLFNKLWKLGILLFLRQCDKKWMKFTSSNKIKM